MVSDMLSYTETSGKRMKVGMIKIGQGIDVHAFHNNGQAKQFVILAGVEIEHTHSLLAHSDGDVVVPLDAEAFEVDARVARADEVGQDASAAARQRPAAGAVAEVEPHARDAAGAEDGRAVRQHGAGAFPLLHAGLQRGGTRKPVVQHLVERLQRGAAVHPTGLVQLARDAVEVAGQHPDAERP